MGHSSGHFCPLSPEPSRVTCYWKDLTHSCDCLVMNADSQPALGHRAPAIPPRGNTDLRLRDTVWEGAPQTSSLAQLLLPAGPSLTERGLQVSIPEQSSPRGPFQLSGTAGVRDCLILLGRCSGSLMRKPENPTLS